MKNIQVEELHDLILNKVPGPYVLKYWNLHSDMAHKPEVFLGDSIIIDGDYDIEKNERIYLCLRDSTSGIESDGLSEIS